MQMRDIWAFALTILAAPFFILVYFAITSGGSTTYSVMYRFDDKITAKHKQELLKKLEMISYNDGPAALQLKECRDTTTIRTSLADRKSDVFIGIPSGFFDSLEQQRPPHFLIMGEAGNPKYAVGLIFTIMGIENLVKSHVGISPAYTFQEVFTGNSMTKTEFEAYAPGIFIFSIIMLILSCSLTLIRDVEDGTMLRLRLSRMTTFDYLAGNSVVQWFTGVLSFGLTLWLATLLGFRSAGSLVVALIVCSLTILSVIAISLILVAFCRNATMVMIIGNFPLFILMFFSGSMLPIPTHEIIAGFALNDLLPPTHAVIAINKVFTYGAGLKEIGKELSALVLLTAGYFTAGTILFSRRHMKINR